MFKKSFNMPFENYDEQEDIYVMNSEYCPRNEKIS